MVQESSDESDGGELEDSELEDSELEALVARVFELAREQGPGAVEAVCREVPGRAEAIREQLARLDQFGMLPTELLGDGNDGLGKYELIEPLGSGGMGVVYRARDVENGTTVALKTLDSRLALTDRLRARFRREIEALRRIDHPRVVGVIDVGERAGLPYYTMPFVRGATLGELLRSLRERRRPGEPPTLDDVRAAWAAKDRRGALDLVGRSYVEVVCRFALDLAQALSAVHAADVVHRDVKPSNALIGGDGRANLFDLGLAHIVDDSRLTHTGDFAGSPHYAAPEQVDGPSGSIGPRTDLWSLGATLFEALALRPPFEGSNTPEILRQIARDEAPRLRQVAPWAPRDLETLVSCCLERDPARRYASAAELAADLERFLDFRPVEARPIGAVERLVRLARRHRAASTAGALALALAVGTPIGLWQHGLRLGEQRDRAEFAAREARREASENREVSRFLESLILGLDRTGRPTDRQAARDLIARANGRLEAGEDLRPLTRAGLRTTVAEVLVGMGRGAEAVPLLDRALFIRQTELGEAHTETATTLQELASLHLDLGDVESARGLVERGRRSLEALGEAPRTAALAAENRARLALLDGDRDAALAHLTDARELLRTIETTASADEVRVLRRRAATRLQEGAATAAVDDLEQALEVNAAGWIADDSAALELLELLGAAESELGRDDRARAALDRALDLRRKLGRTGEPAAVELLDRLAALHGSPTNDDPLRDRRRLELRVLGGEARLALGLPGARAPLEAVVARAGEADSNLVGRARLGLARVALAEGGGADAADHLERAAELPRTPSPEAAWADEVLLERLELAADEAPAVNDLAAEVEAWFLERVDLATVADRALTERLRRAALALLERRQPDRAERLLAAADRFDEELDDGEAPVGLDYRSLLAGTYAESMQRGITYLQAERWSAAIEAFELCAAARPTDYIAPYNMACARARLGEVEGAIADLEAAVDRGYAFRIGAVDRIAADPDLAILSASPRFEALLDRMRALVDAAERFSSEARIHAPSGLDPRGPTPVLFVLHADGATADDVVAGPWRALADRLGWLLVAPSARIPAALDPRDGMLWTDSLPRYAARSRYYEAPVRDARAAVEERWNLDRQRLLIAGEGLGGTLAFHIAVRSPELFSGCLLIDSSVPTDLVGDLAPRLAELDLRVALLSDLDRRAPGMPDGLTTAAYLAQTVAQLKGWGLSTTVATPRGAGDGPDLRGVEDAITFLERGSDAR